ncbi:hypothetical protein V6N13_087761 [Hibiscus sabdariffa]|uniref:Uncharacterized protein n=1 Tax=Hibiscus sabdariffa TaxID=183260 RepID=A0ABR2FXP9_9ROSI
MLFLVQYNQTSPKVEAFIERTKASRLYLTASNNRVAMPFILLQGVTQIALMPQTAPTASVLHRIAPLRLSCDTSEAAFFMTSLCKTTSVLHRFGCFSECEEWVLNLENEDEWAVETNMVEPENLKLKMLSWRIGDVLDAYILNKRSTGLEFIWLDLILAANMGAAEKPGQDIESKRGRAVAERGAMKKWFRNVQEWSKELPDCNRRAWVSCQVWCADEEESDSFTLDDVVENQKLNNEFEGQGEESVESSTENARSRLELTLKVATLYRPNQHARRFFFSCKSVEFRLRL